MSIILGRWPLIPDERCTVSLPHDIFGTTNFSDVNAPSEFCERRLQIKLTKIASDILTSNGGKPPTEPAIIDKNMKRLKVELLDKLPPAFRLYDAEEEWDEELPHLKRQREMFRISVLATICLLLRPTIVMLASRPRALSPSDRDLVAKHRDSLADALIEMLDSVGRLHTLMGGKHNRFFLLSFFTLEPAALLGMYLMTPNVSTKEGKQVRSAPDSSRREAVGDQDRWRKGWKRMEEAIARLEMLSEVSSIARTGIKVLKKMVTKINETHMAKSWKGETTNKPTEPRSRPRSPISPTSQISTDSQSSVSSEKLTNFSVLPPFDTTPPFSYHPAQSHEELTQFNTLPERWSGTHGLDMQSYHSTCNNMNRDMAFADGMTNNNLPLLDIASVPWPGYTAPIFAGGADLMAPTDPDQYTPDMVMDPDIDWNWMGQYGEMLWFGK